MMKKALSPGAMKSHPEGGEGKCLPAGYKASGGALNLGEVPGGAEPQLCIPRQQLEAPGAVSCTPEPCGAETVPGRGPAEGIGGFTGSQTPKSCLVLGRVVLSWW